MVVNRSITSMLMFLPIWWCQIGWEHSELLPDGPLGVSCHDFKKVARQDPKVARLARQLPGVPSGVKSCPAGN
jgi:hypothetical protein